MNPGKVVDAYRMDENLRLAAVRTRRPRRRTSGSRPTRAASRAPRCAAWGWGSAAGSRAGTMCPSFMVTREEKHSTRGRARLLLRDAGRRGAEGRLARRERQGGARPVPGLQGLQERLPGAGGHGDLQGRVPVPLLRGAAAAARGLRDGAGAVVGAPGRRARPRWSTPRWQHEPWARLWKTLGGIAPERRLPRLARRRFAPGSHAKARAARGRGARSSCGRTPSTTTSSRSTARSRGGGAGGRRLRGGRPRRARCAAAARSTTPACSDRARRLAAGGPGGDAAGARGGHAHRGASSRAAWPSSATSCGEPAGRRRGRGRLCAPGFGTLAEFLARRGPRARRPPCGGRRVVQGHCHQKAVLGRLDGDARVLARAGRRLRDARRGLLRDGRRVRLRGREQYEVSMRVGERVLLPAVRAAGRGRAGRGRRIQLPRADRAGTDRRALHLAEVLHLALRGSRSAGGRSDEKATAHRQAFSDG